MTLITRRNLARMLGGSAAAAALTPFVPRSTYAGGSTSPKRLLVIFHGLGYLESSFWPTAGPSGTETDFTLGETQSVLEPYRDQLIYPDGLVLWGAPYYFPDDDNEHASGGSMCFSGSLKDGFATGASFEQPIADHFFKTQGGSFRHVGLGVNGVATEHHSCFFYGDQQPVVPINGPAAAFDNLFAGLDVGDLDVEALQRLRDQRRSVIDVVRDDLNVVQSRVGTVERDILEQHLEHLRALEERVTDFQVECTMPDAPGKTPDDAAAIDAQSDLVASAFACGLTNVMTLQLGHVDGNISMIEGLNAHGTTHAVGETDGAPDVLADHRAIDRWWADRWLHLLDRLASIQEVDGSLLDNTLIVWGTDTTTGTSYSTGPHRHWRMPYFMAGGGNWAFPTGRYLQIPHPDGVNQEQFAQWQTNHRLY
ncbi:MAG: DUF1552 domain-containing protein, partial [Myxococcota bacterium]